MRFLTICLTEVESFDDVNTVYRAYFNDQLPARVTVGGALPSRAGVEIGAIVAL